ncbi:hypothetical protein V2J09_015588 [Rumex salicifolius]
MTDGSCKKSKLSWPKNLVKKWFNIKSKDEEFHADHVIYRGGDEDWTNNFTEREVCCPVKKGKTVGRKSTDRIRRGKLDPETSSQVTDVNNYKVFVATWNVAGKSPPSHLNLDDWLHTSPPADIYVLGFQEIVPLNAGNVLGTEDDGPAKKWLSLIRRTLNNIPGCSNLGGCQSPLLDPMVESEADFEGSTRSKAAASPYFHRRSFQSLGHNMRTNNDMMMSQPRANHGRFSLCERGMFDNRPSDYYDPSYNWVSSDDECGHEESPVTNYSPMGCNGGSPMEEKDEQSEDSRYCLVASKQMVGLFLTVWVKNDIRDDVRNLKVSCVGRGLMGYLGNKGSISISMSLHRTSFCFVCSHLTSGQKEGDELRRNSDVMEILRKTRFLRVHGKDDNNSPQTILEHDRIIWLGDLNYRIALSYRSANALLRIEQTQGRVFDGWSEGSIYFPPTYKYSNNSDRYAGDDRNRKAKRRTPAWCDRILWHGKGIYQLSYVRGESRFSDHRPVYSVFLAEVESVNRCRIKRSMNCASARIEVEELLPHSQVPYSILPSSNAMI